MELLTSYTNQTLREMQNDENVLMNAFDQEHIILFWNRKCELYFGMMKEEVLGKKFENVFPQFRDDERMTDMSRALQGRHLTRFASYDKSNVRYAQKLIPVRDEDGKVIAVLNMVQDMK